LAEKLYRVGENLAVTDDGLHVVGRTEGRSEQADFLDRASDSRGSNEVPTLNGCRITKNTPPAKFDSSPDHAMPMATPAAAMVDSSRG